MASIPVKNEGCGPEAVHGEFEHTLFLGCSVMSFSASAGWNEQQSEVTIQLVEDNCVPPNGAPKYYYDSNLTKQQWNLADPGFFGVIEAGKDVDTGAGGNGYNVPIIGAPAYFRVGDFEYTGLIQSWEETNSDTGNPTYVVKLVDPRAIIENSHVIVNDHAGTVGPVANIINAYGFLEAAFGVGCPDWYQAAPGFYRASTSTQRQSRFELIDGTVFGSPAQAYGGANLNYNGLSWNQLSVAMSVLLAGYPNIKNASPFNLYSPYGRLLFKAPNAIDFPYYSSNPLSMGLGSADIDGYAEYLLDISELPEAPSYYRIDGTSFSILDAVSELCQAATHDYYVELLPVSTEGSILKYIKFRTSDRREAPASNQIPSYVDTSGKTIISYSKGKELRNEITQSFVIGGKKNNLYQADRVIKPDIILPYFGLDSFGNTIIPILQNDGYWAFFANAEELQSSMRSFQRNVPSQIYTTEKELLAALSSFDVWHSYISTINAPIFQAIFDNTQVLSDDDRNKAAVNGIKGILDIDAAKAGLIKAVANAANTKFNGHDLIKAGADAFVKDTDKNDMTVLKTAYQWVKRIADEYYGKKFQVLVPYVCSKIDAEAVQYIHAEDPAEAGFTEVTPVIGLPNNIIDPTFRTTDNRLRAFTRWGTAVLEDGFNAAKLEHLDPDDVTVRIVPYRGGQWQIPFVTCDVDPEWVYLDKSNRFSPRAIITLPDRIVFDSTRDENGDFIAGVAEPFNALMEIIKAARDNAGNDLEDLTDNQIADIVSEIQKVVGGSITQEAWENRSLMPDAAAIGIQSNVLSYGPWFATSGTAGGVQVIKQDGLSPWEYGGFFNLWQAGIAIAGESNSSQIVFEQGSVTFAGYSDLAIGAELFSTPVAITSLSGSLVDAGAGFQYAKIQSTPWVGTYGPNITGVTTQVGQQGLQTTYSMRTWTPKFGKFSRPNAERIKQIGQARIKSSRQVRTLALESLKQRKLIANDAALAVQRRLKSREGRLLQTSSPHMVLAGEIVPWNTGNYSRPSVSTSSITELNLVVNKEDPEYQKKAVMSLDGLLRPVSVQDAAGTLPQFATAKLGGVQTHGSRGTQPPVDKTGAAGSLLEYNPSLDIKYLHPLQNPSSYQAITGRVAQDKSDTPTVGHDIEILGRDWDAGEAVPGEMGMAIQGYLNNNGDLTSYDYKEDYRMLALRGPLLMQGWGYDLDGFPIPNKADSEAAASTGNFTDASLQNKFLDNHLRKSDTWPVGPIDLRWDRDRACWTIPQYRLVNATADQLIAATVGSTGTAILDGGPTLYDGSGNAISNPEITVINKVGNAVNSGDKLIASFDPYLGEYHIIECKASGAGGESGPECRVYYDSGSGCPPSRTTGNAAGWNINPNVINYGGGMYLDTVNRYSVDLEASEIAGIGCSGESILNIEAGLDAFQDDDCIISGDLSDGAPYNKITFKRGITAQKDTGTTCGIDIMAGSKYIRGTSSQMPPNGWDLPDNWSPNTITLGSGLIAGRTSPGQDCGIVISVSGVGSTPGPPGPTVEAQCVTDCIDTRYTTRSGLAPTDGQYGVCGYLVDGSFPQPSGGFMLDPTKSGLFNNIKEIKFGAGTRVGGFEDDGVIEVGAGFHVATETPDPVSGGIAFNSKLGNKGLYNTLQAHCGIRMSQHFLDQTPDGDILGDCTVGIGSYTEVSDTETCLAFPTDETEFNGGSGVGTVPEYPCSMAFGKGLRVAMDPAEDDYYEHSRVAIGLAAEIEGQWNSGLSNDTNNNGTSANTYFHTIELGECLAFYDTGTVEGNPSDPNYLRPARECGKVMIDQIEKYWGDNLSSAQIDDIVDPWRGTGKNLRNDLTSTITAQVVFLQDIESVCNPSGGAAKLTGHYGELVFGKCGHLLTYRKSCESIESIVTDIGNSLGVGGNDCQREISYCPAP